MALKIFVKFILIIKIYGIAGIAITAKCVLISLMKAKVNYLKMIKKV